MNLSLALLKNLKHKRIKCLTRLQGLQIFNERKVLNHQKLLSITGFFYFYKFLL